VDLADRAHRQMHGRDRAVVEMLGVEDHEVGAAAPRLLRVATPIRYPAPSGAFAFFGAKQALGERRVRAR
jgi:hypothetical protein